MLRKIGKQRFPDAGFVVGVIETGRHRCPEKSESAAGKQPRALPDSSRDDVLQEHAGGDVVAENDRMRRSVLAQKKRFHRIAHIEVKHFVAGKFVESRESLRREQIKDGGCKKALACIGRSKRGAGKTERGAIRFDEITALDRMRAQAENFPDLFGGERHAATICLAAGKGKGRVGPSFGDPGLCAGGEKISGGRAARVRDTMGHAVFHRTF